MRFMFDGTISLGIVTVNDDGSINLPDELFTKYGWDWDDDVTVEKTESGLILVSNISYIDRCRLGCA